MKKLTASLTLSLCIPQAAVHTSWSWRGSTLKIALYALIHNNVNYAAQTWQLWLSATKISCWVCLQNRAPGPVTSRLVSTPLEALRLEGNILSYNTCSNRLILRAQEKELQSSNDHLKRLALTPNIPQHISNCYSFHRKADDLAFPIELEHSQLINHFSSPQRQFCTPWQEHVSTFVHGIAAQVDDSAKKGEHSVTYIAPYMAE